MSDAYSSEGGTYKPWLAQGAPEGGMPVSWASHNPELYDEIRVEGIAAKLAFISDEEKATAVSIVETIRHECPRAFVKLSEWADKEVVGAERQHFAKLADAAKKQAREESL